MNAERLRNTREATGKKIIRQAKAARNSLAGGVLALSLIGGAACSHDSSKNVTTQGSAIDSVSPIASSALFTPDLIHAPDYVQIAGKRFDNDSYTKNGSDLRQAIKKLPGYTLEYVKDTFYDTLREKDQGKEYLNDGIASTIQIGEIRTIEDAVDPKIAGVVLRHEPAFSWVGEDGVENLAVFDGAQVEVIGDPIHVESPNPYYSGIYLLKVRVVSRTHQESGIAAFPGTEGYIDPFWFKDKPANSSQR